MQKSMKGQNIQRKTGISEIENMDISFASFIHI